MPKARIFNIMQYVNHPESGEPLLNEETIKMALAHRTIKRWSYVLHDKDTYTKADEAENPKHKEGTLKPPHWHIAVQMKDSNYTEVYTIAKWFGISENFVSIARGKGAFLDLIEYETHEAQKQQDAGKHRYADEEVHCSESFNFREELIKRAESKLKYGSDLSVAEQMKYDIYYSGVSLKEMAKKHPVEFVNNIKTLEHLRLKYIDDKMEPPRTRINFYIEGAGGIGKGLMSRALARVLCNPENKEDDEVFFEVGANNATFEGYDGQPVIIWNDCRAYTLLDILKGRENVFNVFDPYPPNIKQNVKYSSIRLKNHINIVNGIQTWDQFLDGLAGEYINKVGQTQKSEDKSQSYRRFPFFMVLHESDFDLGINKGMLNGTREYEQHLIMRGISGSMKKIVETCGNNTELRDKVSQKMLAPVESKTREMENKMERNQTLSDEEIWAMAEDYGKQTKPTVEYVNGDDYKILRTTENI